MCHIKLQASYNKPAWFFFVVVFLFLFSFLISISICRSLHSLWEEKEKEKKNLERKINQEIPCLAPVLPATKVSSHIYTSASVRGFCTQLMGSA